MALLTSWQETQIRRLDNLLVDIPDGVRVELAKGNTDEIRMTFIIDHLLLLDNVNEEVAIEIIKYASLSSITDLKKRLERKLPISKK